MVDAGDLFYDKFRAPGEDAPRWKDTAEFLVTQFNATGVDAITLGDRDTYLGPKVLRALRKKAKFPFLVANLIDTETHKPYFEDHMIKTIDGVKVGLFGVTMKAAARNLPSGPAPWRADDPVATAKREVAALKAAGAEIIVAITHLSEADERTLAREVEGITAILGGNGVRMLQHPERVEGTFVADAFSKGKYVSVMVLHLWEGKPASAPLADRFRRQGLLQQIEQVDARLASYERILEAKEKEAAPTPTDAVDGKGVRRSHVVNTDFYRKQLVQFRAEKQQLEMDLEEATEVDPRANYITYELAPVRKDLEDTKDIGEAVDTFRKKWPKIEPGKQAREALNRDKSAPKAAERKARAATREQRKAR